MHILHLLWNEENPDNKYNLSLAGGSTIRNTPYNKLEGNYSDSYYFSKRKDMAEAVDYLKNLEKQPNQQSQYSAKEQGGTKTYKAKIGKVVKYFGNNNLEFDQFMSLYLDCGAVVELHYKGMSGNMADKTIDCVTDDNNKVIIHEIIKE